MKVIKWYNGLRHQQMKSLKRLQKLYLLGFFFQFSFLHVLLFCVMYAGVSFWHSQISDEEYIQVFKDYQDSEKLTDIKQKNEGYRIATMSYLVKVNDGYQVFFPKTNELLPIPDHFIEVEEAVWVEPNPSCNPPLAVMLKQDDVVYGVNNCQVLKK